MMSSDETKATARPRRSRLPSPMVSRNDVSLWSILKHCIGKELSKIAMPVVFNEPLSFLQRIAENGEYSHILEAADLCDDPLERMELVCAFAVAALSSNWLRMNKPFNPILGETYELELEKGFRIVCEQVSHHPPVSAYHGESEHFTIHGSVQPKLRFWGKSIEVKPDGYINVKLKRHDEVYTWRNVNCCVHNIIVGQLWFEQYGLMEIVNHSNGLRAVLNFKAAGWFGKDLHRLDGFIFAKDRNTKLRFLYGKWTDYLKSASVEDYDDYMKENAHSFRVPDKPADGQTSKKMFGKLNSLTRTLTGTSVDVPDNNGEHVGTENGSELPKSDSSHSIDIANSRLLWVVDPRPEYSPEYHNFTLYSMFLNQLDDDLKGKLAPTDSRLRPDVRLLEEGDIDAAAAEKNRLEEKQREARKLRKKQKQEFSPLWFKNQKNTFTKEDDWLYCGGYWDRNYSQSIDIY